MASIIKLLINALKEAGIWKCNTIMHVSPLWKKEGIIPMDTALFRIVLYLLPYPMFYSPQEKTILFSVLIKRSQNSKHKLKIWLFFSEQLFKSNSEI